MQVQGQFNVIFPDGTRIGNFVMIRSNTVIGNHVSLQSGC